MVSRFALAPVIAVALVAVASSISHAQVDPWGPAAHSAPVGQQQPARQQLRPPPGGVTRLLGVMDGTPRYEGIPDPAHSHLDSVASRLLPVYLHNNTPVGAGDYSPILTGPNGGGLAYWDYLVRYWETYPHAKERAGHTPRLGRVHFTIQASQVEHGWAPPPGVRAELERQAQAVVDAVLAHPYMQRSEDVATSAMATYTRRRDQAGTEVYGFQVRFGFGKLRRDARQAPDGRWDGNLPGPASLVIHSNFVPSGWRSAGFYRGIEVLGNRAPLIKSIERPIWVSEFRGGQGPSILNPELFDPARPKTDIQVLVVESSAQRFVGGPRTAPDTDIARSVAAAFSTDWKDLVDRLNSPGAPRAR